MSRTIHFLINHFWTLLFVIFIVLMGAFIASEARAQESAAAYFTADQARLHPPARHRAAPRGAPPRQQATRSRLLAEASRWIGSRNPTGTVGPWCRDFLNFTIVRAGYALNDRSRMARDAVRLGRRVTNPRPGDIAVMRKHVTIAKEFVGDVVYGLGGNQCGGRVCVSRYSARRIIAYVRLEA